MQNNSPAADGAAAESSGRPAAEIFDDFMELAADAVDATGTTGWTYADGSPWNPEAPDIAFNPAPCQKTADGAEQRFMQFGLLGPPADVDPREAREQMRAYMEERGYDLARSMDPPPGNKTKNTYIISANRSDGAFIDYGANDGEQRLNLRSECSDHPSLRRQVSAQTR
ncbi:hypothetical protein ABIB35_003600 [Arthrobacter sp. UYP6]|uniref:hypothetical protein n=1 Tax=Arthrobacter sp. UYP6 TaxID=1756378 RepID=UPI003394BCD3